MSQSHVKTVEMKIHKTSGDVELLKIYSEEINCPTNAILLQLAQILDEILVTPYLWSLTSFGMIPIDLISVELL
jgi:hypothetical protein